MKNWRRGFHLVLGNTFTLLVTYFLLSNQAKVDIRYALFSRVVTRQEFLSLKDSILIDKKIIKKKIYNKYQTIDSLSFQFKIYNVLDFFEPYKSSYGCGEFAYNLDLNINNVLKGNGCCSDFSQVFMAICNQNKLNVCEINNSTHTFNEVSDFDNKKKIWIDAENKLFAKDENGNFLSTIEIYDNFKLGNKILLYTLGNDLELTKIDSSKLFTKKSFNFLILTNIKDVLYEDEISKQYNFLPKDLINTILIVKYKYPRYFIFDDSGEFIIRLQNIKNIFLFYIIFLLSFNFLLYKLLFKKN
jgi:hypothetical protein